MAALANCSFGLFFVLSSPDGVMSLVALGPRILTRILDGRLGGSNSTRHKYPSNLHHTQSPQPSHQNTLPTPLPQPTRLLVTGQSGRAEEKTNRHAGKECCVERDVWTVALVAEGWKGVCREEVLS